MRQETSAAISIAFARTSEGAKNPPYSRSGCVAKCLSLASGSGTVATRDIIFLNSAFTFSLEEPTGKDIRGGLASFGTGSGFGAPSGSFSSAPADSAAAAAWQAYVTKQKCASASARAAPESEPLQTLQPQPQPPSTKSSQSHAKPWASPQSCLKQRSRSRCTSRRQLSPLTSMTTKRKALSKASQGALETPSLPAPCRAQISLETNSSSTHGSTRCWSQGLSQQPHRLLAHI